MPSEKDLPRGPVRDFVEVLFWLFNEAHRPTLREISREIERSNLRATASPETIRRMLQGRTLPRWPILEAVFIALCNIADVEPNEYFDRDDDSTRREILEFRWHEALDSPNGRDRQPARTGGFAADDPWGTAGSDGDNLSDEAPF